jgi:Cu(I)/Ag(I) efflux system membrane fusion protein
MNDVPAYGDEASAGAGSSEVPGHTSFKLSSERQQLIGVRRGTVEMRDLAEQVRTVGTVAYDPELYRALVEYRQAAGRAGAQGLAGAATLRLRQMGLSDDLIKTLARFDPQTLLLPGKEVWVYAQVFEYEIELLRPGQTVTVRADTGVERKYTGKIVAVDSILSAETRSARARILVPTPDASLRPQTFVHVTVDVPLGRKLAVPEDAVFDTGERRFVFVVTGGGTFEPRAVELGAHAGEWFEARAGLREGENVVTSANFLIDSESRFRAAVAAFTERPPAAHRE